MESKLALVKIKEALEFLDIKEEDLLAFIDKKILRPVFLNPEEKNGKYKFKKEELVRFKKEQDRLLAGLTEGKDEIFFFEKKFLVLRNQLDKKREQLSFLNEELYQAEKTVSEFLKEAEEESFKIEKVVSKEVPVENIREETESSLMDFLVEPGTENSKGLETETLTLNQEEDQKEVEEEKEKEKVKLSNLKFWCFLKLAKIKKTNVD
jgi:hypothetical protein